MIKKFILPALIASVTLLASCAKMVAPPYSTVDKVAKLSPGMTSSDVSSALGIPPYDVYHMAGDGSTLHVYWYKIKERKNKGCSLFMTEFYNKEENLTIGSSYYTKEQRVYVLFQNGKLSSLVTDAGLDNSADILVANNTIQFISKTGRHAFNYYNYEKLELGQQLVRLDNKGNFKKTDGGMIGKAKVNQKGCFGK